MDWIYIRDKQPEHDEMIIRINPPYDGHWCMGMQKYYQGVTWEELVKWQKDNDCEPFDFWWIAAKDFPFPKLVN
jgi:hypothetical protein